MDTHQLQTVKGSDLLVAALENEGVDRIFGIPGEENLEVVESIRKSSIQLVNNMCAARERNTVEIPQRAQ